MTSSTDSMRILCVIPVRGGSKGVPGKNARLVAGKPLVAWTIGQALAARPAMDVVVSTDDERLARIAREAGAEVPFLRPAELAQDTTPTEPVVRHAIEERTKAGRRPDAVMLLQATSPVRLPGTIDRAIVQFAETGVDSLVGVVPQTPFLWRTPAAAGGEHAAADTAFPHFDVDARPRRQDLDVDDYFYRETGSLYLTRTELYEQRDNRIGGRVGLFVMSDDEGVDIDTLLDLEVAQQQLERLFSGSAPETAQRHGAASAPDPTTAVQENAQ